MLARNITAKVTLLSDLHIGAGNVLIKGLDWIARSDDHVYFADHAAILETILARAIDDGKDELDVVNAITGMKLDDLVDAGWLHREDFRSSSLFPYRYRGQPATSQIREQMKSVNQQPYLPGSSLKGAIRTIIATVAADELQPDANERKLDGRVKWAAKPIEQTLFGSDPNHDFLRLLQVSDSAPVSADRLRLRRAHIYPTSSQSQRGRSRGLDIDLETVARDTEFTLSLHMPLELLEKSQGAFEKRRNQELRDWERRRAWLDNLADHGRDYARRLLIEEVTYFQKRTDVPAVHRFYNFLVDRFSKLTENQFMLPLGWGTGWHTKTLNQYLKKDSQNFEKIAKKYRLDPTGSRQPEDRFPKSRHLLRQPNGEPSEPLGWIMVELADRS